MQRLLEIFGELIAHLFKARKMALMISGACCTINVGFCTLFHSEIAKNSINDDAVESLPRCGISSHYNFNIFLFYPDDILCLI